MVADAVCDEPVSGLKSLITGKIQGNFGEMASKGNLTPENPKILLGCLEIPCAR